MRFSDLCFPFQLKARSVTAWRPTGEHTGEISFFCWWNGLRGLEPAQPLDPKLTPRPLSLPSQWPIEAERSIPPEHEPSVVELHACSSRSCTITSADQVGTDERLAAQQQRSAAQSQQHALGMFHGESRAFTQQCDIIRRNTEMVDCETASNLSSGS